MNIPKRAIDFGMVGIVLLVAVLRLGLDSSHAQIVSPLASSKRGDRSPGLHSALAKAEGLTKESLAPQQLRESWKKLGLQVRDGETILVEIIAPTGATPVTQKRFTPFGGQITGTWKHRVKACIPADRLSAVEEALPLGYSMRPVMPLGVADVVVGEGPAVTLSQHYQGIHDGSGLTIGVIDVGFTGLAAAQQNGDAPLPIAVADYTGTGLEVGDIHGTGTLEAAYDHCPGAEWRLYKIESVTDLGQAVVDATAFGVDIIIHSIAYANTGWEDDSGDVCSATTDAAEAGILFFTAAGNHAQRHWQGPLNPGPPPSFFHRWTYTDSDGNVHDTALPGLLPICVPPGGEVSVFLSWNTCEDPGMDLDLFLYDSAGLLAASTNSGSVFEWVYWVNDTSDPKDDCVCSDPEHHCVWLVVEPIAGGTAEIEVIDFSKDDTWELFIPESSTVSPSNCTHPNVIAVGAVDHGDFGAAAVIQDYSSRGPSNSGNLLPDLCGPTNIFGFTYDNIVGPYGGTSCATPNAAGATAVMWSMNPNLSADEVRTMLFQYTLEFSDWGDPGFDTVFGRGGLVLPPSSNCNGGALDLVDIVSGNSTDVDHDGVPDDCGSSFAFLTPDPVVRYDPDGSHSGAGLETFGVTLSIVEGTQNSGYPNDTEAFAMGLVHDPTYLKAVGVSAVGPIPGLNGATGPELFFSDIQVDSVFAAVIYDQDNVNPPTLQFTTSTEVIEIEYETVPTLLIEDRVGIRTDLVWTALGDPPTPNLIVYGGQSFSVQTDDLVVHLQPFGLLDCNSNGVADDCDVSSGSSPDCNGNGTPDECETDCNANGIPDDCDIALATSSDCNGNLVPDECDIAQGFSGDCNANGVPDECDPDCNGNGVPDDCDIADGNSGDCDLNTVPDECDIASGTPDCNSNAVPDSCDVAAGSSLDCNSNGIPDECDLDCNSNTVPDDCDIADGTSSDCNANGVPDECDLDCNTNGIPDDCDVTSGTSPDCNANLVPDECEIDCDANGTPDDCDIASGTSSDCNANGIPDSCDLTSGTSADCNGNGTPDDCDIASGTSDDCNANGIADECELDCNGNGVADECDIATGTSNDCNGNGSPDSCDVAGGSSLDCNSNATPDECETDCNANGVPDDCDISSGTSPDCTANGIPDECDLAAGTNVDCNGNMVPDICDVSSGSSSDCNTNGTPDECEADCNSNGTPDECDISNGTSLDCNVNGDPDECDIANGTSADCNANTVPDSCDLSSGTSLDCNSNGIPDECEADCNNNGVPDDCDLSVGTSLDCNSNGKPDECDIAAGTSLDCNSDGIPDECETDCNTNGVPDDCDISSGTSDDCDGNGIPDECDIASGTSSDCNANGTPDSCDISSGASSDCNSDGTPDECETDCNSNGTPDDCDIASGTSPDVNANGVPDECESFRRGDCNGDTVVDISDAVRILLYLFGFAGSPPCLVACDGNDDGMLNIADGIYILSSLFLAGAPLPPPPFPGCGVDPTPNSLTCVNTSCP